MLAEERRADCLKAHIWGGRSPLFLVSSRRHVASQWLFLSTIGLCERKLIYSLLGTLNSPKLVSAYQNLNMEIFEMTDVQNICINLDYLHCEVTKSASPNLSSLVSLNC